MINSLITPEDRSSDPILSKTYYEELFTNTFVNKDLYDFLKGKKVVVVGPASYVKNKGSDIDSYDVIVRFNKSWRMLNDQSLNIGQRVDVLWHCSSELHCGELEFDVLEDLGVKFVVIQFPPNYSLFHFDIELIIAKYKSYSGQLRLIIPDNIQFHLGVRKGIGSRPNVGVSAIFELLQYSPSVLYVTGMSFFRTPHSKSYGRTAKEVSNMTEHNSNSQILVLKILSDLFDILVFDEFIKLILVQEKPDNSVKGGSRRTNTLVGLVYSINKFMYKCIQLKKKWSK